MSESRHRTQNHEAGHFVIAWLLADRIEAIGGVHTTKNHVGETVAHADIKPLSHYITGRNAAKVGVAGFLAEARGAARRRNHESEYGSATGLGSMVLGFIQQHLAGLAPEEGAWRVNVDIRPGGLTRAIASLDDIRHVANYTDADSASLLKVIEETQELLKAPDNWRAVLKLSQIIPSKSGRSVEAAIMRNALQELMPRSW